MTNNTMQMKDVRISWGSNHLHLAEATVTYFPDIHHPKYVGIESPFIHLKLPYHYINSIIPKWSIVKRPPMVLMTETAAKKSKCETLKKMMDSGAEVVIVADHHLEKALRIAEKIRKGFKEIHII